jgi:hypothetical protein
MVTTAGAMRVAVSFTLACGNEEGDLDFRARCRSRSTASRWRYPRRSLGPWRSVSPTLSPIAGSGRYRLAQLMVVLDVAIVNVALSSIQHSLAVTEPGLAWVIDAYTLSYGGLVLLGGRLADLFERRTVFLASVGLFVAASLCCGLASTPAEFFVARFVQGMGAAATSPTALSLVATMVPPGPARNRVGNLRGTRVPRLSCRRRRRTP